MHITLYSVLLYVLVALKGLVLYFCGAQFALQQTIEYVVVVMSSFKHYTLFILRHTATNRPQDDPVRWRLIRNIFG